MSRPVLTFMLVILTMTAFAANSVLSRLALAEGEMGAWTFTAIRFISGALMLLCFVGIKQTLKSGQWRGALALLTYGIFFSFAYLLLAAGTGALILFAMVQLTMLGWGYYTGERLTALQWFGFVLAVGGLLYLLSPGLEAPSFAGAILMGVSGIGWGIYSVLGKGVANPTQHTAGNFVKAALILIVMTGPVLLLSPEAHPSWEGVCLALASGVITSALGYALWYYVLKDITVTRAGLAQLTVPAFAALGGVLFISEPLTPRFLLSTIIILCGVGLATLTRPKKIKTKARP